MSSLAEVPLPDSLPPANETDASYLDQLMSNPKLDAGRMAAVEIPAAEPVLPAAEPPKVETPPVDTPPAAPAKRPEAQFRIENRTLKEENERLLKELEEIRSGKTELETSLTEHKTLAQQEKERAEKLEKAWRNEAAVLPADLIAELPEVKTAQESFNAVARNLFPELLSDPHDDSDPDIRMGELDSVKMGTIGRYIDQWEDAEYGKDAPAVKAETQRALISAIAKTIGVNPSKFVSENFRGHDFEMLPKNHPVHGHLRDSLRKFVQERQKFTSVRQAAVENAKGSLSAAQEQKVANTRNLFSAMGVGLTGDALDSALAKSPDSTVHRTMKLLGEHQDLLEELKGNMDLEATLNGHLRPHYDFLEDDPSDRTAKAQAFNIRMGKRAGFGAMAEPLMKGWLREREIVNELREKLKAAEAEAASTRRQGEPGGGGGFSGDPGAVGEEDGDADMARIMELARQRRARL